MFIFVLNCGSSSLKYQLLDMVNERRVAVGLVERIGMEGSVLAYGDYISFCLYPNNRSRNAVFTDCG